MVSRHTRIVEKVQTRLKFKQLRLQNFRVVYLDKTVERTDNKLIGFNPLQRCFSILCWAIIPYL